MKTFVFFTLFLFSNAVFATEFTDSTGRTLTLPDEIERVVPSGPAAQMMLFSLAPEKMVGLSNRFTKEMKEYFPKKYHSLPVFGQFYGAGNLNAEALLAAEPQIIIDIGETKSGAAKDMDELTEKLGVPAIHIKATLLGTPEAYRTLGKLLGLEERAERLAVFCEQTYDHAKKIIQQVGEKHKVRVIYASGKEGLNVTTKDNYHSELINLIAENVANAPAQTSRSYGTPINMEQLLIWNPDVILFAPDSIYDRVASSSLWRQLTAVKNKKYYMVPSVPYNWLGTPPSVNRYLGMLWLPALLYPENVSYDLYAEIAQYYKLFYHTDLTQEQFDSLARKSI